MRHTKRPHIRLEFVCVHVIEDPCYGMKFLPCFHTELIDKVAKIQRRV